MNVVNVTELHTLKWFILSYVNFTSTFKNGMVCQKVVSAVEDVLEEI